MKLSKKEKQTLAQLIAKTRAHESPYWWTRAHWKNRMGKKLNFSDHKYLIQIYKDKHPHISVMKASQVGMSEWGIATTFYVADMLDGNVGYFFPASSQVGDFVQARIDPAVEKSEYLSSITGKGLDNQKSSDKVGMKRVRNAFVYFRGAQSSRQVTSIDLDCAIVDEYDRFKQKTSGNNAAQSVSIAMVEKRMNHSKLRWLRNITTPTIPGYGIDAEMVNTTYNEWHVTCAHCKYEQVLDYWRNVDEKAVKIVCLECSEELTMRNIQDGGRWVPRNPDAEKQGYHITGLMSPRVNLKSIVDGMNSYNEFRVQEVYNQDLGLPYESGERALTMEALNDLYGDYTMPFPKPRLKGVVAGIDVGKPNYMTVMMRNPSTQKPMVIGCHKIEDLEKELPKYIDQYKIGTIVIDAGPERHLVSKLVQKHGNMFACTYVYTKSDAGEYLQWDKKKQTVKAHRTASLDEMYGMILSGVITLPKNAKYIPDFYKHLMAPKRMKATVRGEEIYVYNEGSARDDYAHSTNYALMALEKVVQYVYGASNTVESQVDIDSGSFNDFGENTIFTNDMQL